MPSLSFSFCLRKDELGWFGLVFFFPSVFNTAPSRLPSRPPPHCVGVRKEALRDVKSVFRKLGVKPSQQSPTALLSWRKQTLILEKEIKEKEVVLRQRLVGSFAVSGFLSGHRYQMEADDR